MTTPENALYYNHNPKQRTSKMTTRFIYTLMYLDDYGDWVSTEFKFLPQLEMDKLDEAGKVWKLIIENKKNI